MDLALVAFGLGVGVLVGMTGIGGGSLMTPMLILVFGVTPVTAIGSDLAYAAVTKTVTIEARDNQSNLLAKWELTGVAPSTFSSAAAGNLDEVDSTIEFLFDKLRLVQANGS